MKRSILGLAWVTLLASAAFVHVDGNKSPRADGGATLRNSPPATRTRLGDERMSEPAAGPASSPAHFDVSKDAAKTVVRMK